MSFSGLSRLGNRLITAPWQARSYLYLLERLLLLRNCQSKQPQLFILGLPRTGTTLIYQYIVHRLKVAYFTNSVGRYPLAPCVITWAQNCQRRTYVSDFKSTYGKVEGSLGPREAGGFWNRYFDSEAYQRFSDITPESVQNLQRTICCVQRIYGDVLFVNKNVKHLLRIQALKEIYPRCFFLVVERDLAESALSLLRGRRALLDDPHQWWSVHPPNYEYLRDLPLTEQIAGQLVSLTDRMEQDLAEVPSHRLLRIPYDSFCRDPEALIRHIRDKIGPIADRNGPVEPFAVSRNIPESLDEKELVRKIESGRRLTLP